MFQLQNIFFGIMLIYTKLERTLTILKAGSCAMWDPGSFFHIVCEIFIPYTKALQPIRSHLVYPVIYSSFTHGDDLKYRFPALFTFTVFITTGDFFASVSYALL
jgi:hypothetical protein